MKANSDQPSDCRTDKYYSAFTERNTKQQWEQRCYNCGHEYGSTTHTHDVGKPETIKRMGSEAKKVGSKVGRTEEGQ